MGCTDPQQSISVVLQCTGAMFTFLMLIDGKNIMKLPVDVGVSQRIEAIGLIECRPVVSS